MYSMKQAQILAVYLISKICPKYRSEGRVLTFFVCGKDNSTLEGDCDNRTSATHL